MFVLSFAIEKNSHFFEEKYEPHNSAYHYENNWTDWPYATTSTTKKIHKTDSTQIQIILFISIKLTIFGRKVLQYKLAMLIGNIFVEK